MSVHYKFKSALEYDTVTFDGLHISVKDLKNAILQQKRIGKSTDFDLQVTNAQTKEVYDDENTLIPKNTSLLIARIPVLVQKNKPWEGYGGDSTPPPKIDEGGPIAKAVDLSSLDAPEDDKIKAMMSQSTQEYDPSNYVKIRGANQVGAVPPNYRCYKCHQGGHWIKDCTFSQGPEPLEIKKSTGIPRNFLVPVEGPQVPGAMMTPNGQYAVPILDMQAYTQKVAPAPVPAPKVDIPEDLICSICSDLLSDAVMIPCCGNSFCDECVRSVLLESEDHECPDCHEKDISPDTLIPNRFLRTSVANFKNTTGYVKKPTYREKLEQSKPQVTSTKEKTPPQEPESTEKLNVDEKTVISEADSTEHSKNSDEKDVDPAKDQDKIKDAGSTPEGPPGVSPKGSPRRSPKERERPIHRIRPTRDSKERTRHNSHGSSRHREDSPRQKNSRNMRSPNYNSPISREERSGTPTIDEPTNGGSYPTPYGNTLPSGPGSLSAVIGHVPPIQGPPPHGMPTTFPPGQPPLGTFPPNQGPMPNYRLPPPGSAPFMGPGPYPIPPRGIFDGSRPPIAGFPPNFNPSIPPGARGHRDFNRRLPERTPPGVIDDPLAAFNRMLREKDERKRRAKRRSYSRSRSRSRSFSRSPMRRRNSRSPRPSRRSRSRSRSFSLSRSRSRSYSGSPWGSPYNNRLASPPARRSPMVARRGAPSTRYRSPPPLRPSRSPPLRSRHRDRDFDEEREYGDRERPYKDRNRDRERGRNSRDRRPSSRDRERYYDNYDERSSGNRGDAWQQGRGSIQDGYYPPPADIQQGYQNRFGQGPPRDYGPPFMNKEAPHYGQPPIIPPQRQFQDIKPPGVDDDIAPPGVDEPPPQPLQKLSPKREEKEKERDKEKERRRSSRDRREKSADRDRKRRHERKSRTPDRARNPSPKRKSKSRDRDSPEKHKRRRKDSSDREDRKREHSDDDKSKRSRDKKKHKDKKESEKKKKRDKKDKHKKDSKDKKTKEEFKQVIPKNRNEDSDEEVEDHKDKKKDYDEKSDKEKSKKRVEEKVHKEKEVMKEVSEEHSVVEEEDPVKKTKKDAKVKVKKAREIEIKLKDVKKKEAKVEETVEEQVTSTTPARIETSDLYGDILNDYIDTKVIENYGKLENEHLEEEPLAEMDEKMPHDDDGIEEGEIKEFEDEENEEKDILELHLNDIDLKTELDKTDILAPVPEKSKWEVEEDLLTSPRDSSKSDLKLDKSGKVTNEVLKRAENAIFAKAIKAIRPIEIKKVEKTNNKIQVTVSSAIDLSSPPPPQRLSVKERLGIKVDDPDKVINLSSRNRSRSMSPFSRRGEGGRNYDANERRVELDSMRNRRGVRNRSRSRGRDNSRDRRARVESRGHLRDNQRRGTHGREKVKKEERSRHEDERKSRRKRTRSRSESEEKRDKHKKKDKKQRKEKSRKTKEDDDSHRTEKDSKEDAKPPQVTKRKPTIDEATFEPDYDLESHSEEEEEEQVTSKKKASKKQSEDEEEKSSSSDSESESSSEEDRRKKKHRKHKKRKKKESSSSSSSESESESSDSDRGKKKKKHKKNKKKKKKSKHK